MTKVVSLPCVLVVVHDKGSFFAMRFSYGVRQRSFHAVCDRHRELLFFAGRLPVTHDKKSSLCVVIQGARQWEFTVQIATVCSLPCAPTKNARQRLCRAFLGLCRAPVVHDKPPVSRSASTWFIELLTSLMTYVGLHFPQVKLCNSYPAVLADTLVKVSLWCGPLVLVQL
jgi:hypothetical protein